MIYFKYDEAEWATIGNARRVYPEWPARKLANFLYEHSDTAMCEGVMHRTRQSIYGALRRFDAEMKRLAACAQVIPA